MLLWTSVCLCGMLIFAGVVYATRRGLVRYAWLKVFPPPPPPVRRPPQLGGQNAKPPESLS